MRWILMTAVAGLAVWAALLDGENTPRPVQAQPLSLSVSTPTFVGNSATITFSVQDDLGVSPTYDAILKAAAGFDAGVLSNGVVTGQVDNCDGLPSTNGVADPASETEILFPADDPCDTGSSATGLAGLDTNTTVNERSGSASWSCDEPGPVIISLTQANAAGTPVTTSTVLNCLEEIGQPIELETEVQDEEIDTCPGSTLISVQVQDVTGVPLPDGTIVSFVADGGTLVPGPSAPMFNGWARVTLQVELDDAPRVRVLASFAGITERIDVDVKCGADGSALVDAVSFTLSSSTVECGKSAFLVVRVLDDPDDDDNPVAVDDGTMVSFIANNGTLEPASGATAGGYVTVTYTAPAEPGDDTVTAAVFNVFESTTVTVECEGAEGAEGEEGAEGADGAGGEGGAGADGAGGAGGAGGVGSGSISPPNTGSGGLR